MNCYFTEAVTLREGGGKWWPAINIAGAKSHENQDYGYGPIISYARGLIIIKPCRCEGEPQTAKIKFTKVNLSDHQKNGDCTSTKPSRHKNILYFILPLFPPRPPSSPRKKIYIFMCNVRVAYLVKYTHTHIHTHTPIIICYYN